MEVWKEISGYNERYEVSNYGRVRSNDMIVNGRLQNCHNKKGRILKPHTDKEGYKAVCNHIKDTKIHQITTFWVLQ